MNLQYIKTQKNDENNKLVRRYLPYILTGYDTAVML
jgi:hypothetical protein